MSLATVGDLVFAVGETTTVPSGVPTEAPGEPVQLSVPEGTLTLSGCASPSAFVTIFQDNTPVGTVVANNFGRFSKLIGSQDFGLSKIQAFQEDRFQHISSTAEFSTSLDAHEDNSLEVFLPPTVYHDKDPAVIGEYLTFRGFTCPGATVNLNINNNFILVATANSLGNWWVIADTSLYALGTHTYSVVAQLNSQVSEESDQYIFRTARRFPGDQGNLYPSELTTPQITSPKDRSLTSTRQVTVGGIGPSNTQIELFADDQLVGSAFSNPNGEWNFRYTMTNSQNSLKVRACADNTCTDFSESILVFFSGDVSSCTPLLEIDPVRIWGLRRNDGIDLNMIIKSGAPQYEILLDWGDATVEHITLYRSNDTSYHHVYKDIGQYNGSLTVEDAQGCKETYFFSVSVTKDFYNVPWVLIIFPAALISLVMSLLHYIYRQREDNESLGRLVNRMLSRKPENSLDTEPDQPEKWFHK